MTPYSSKPQKLTYDGKFSGPKGELNPMGLKMPGVLPVQIYPKTSVKWIIRNPQTKGEFAKHEFLTPEQAINHCSQIFEIQHGDWEIRDMMGNTYSPSDETENPKPAAVKSKLGPVLYK
jgi:hypothetical protein